MDEAAIIADLEDIITPNREWIPKNKMESDIAEADLLAEFSNLTVTQREKILHDVHGVAPCIDEEPAFVKSKLAEFDFELGRIEDKHSFLKAKYWNQDYVESEAFRLWFLRCHEFDAKRAANQFVVHFETKQEFFGNGEILGREILLSDLSKEDLDTLKTGFLQLLPDRDAAGRSVTCSTAAFDPGVDPDIVARSLWYYVMVVLRDEETQRKGNVYVIYNYGNYTYGQSDTERLRKAMLAMPLKVAGAHFCFLSDDHPPYMAGTRRLFLPNEYLHQLVKHQGWPDDVTFELQTFGIPMRESPMQSDCSWSAERHLEWIERQREREQSTASNANSIVLPRRFDVLYGRSIVMREHTGNNRLVHICEMRYSEYEETTRPGKAEIAKEIVSDIHEAQGRFLKWENNEWVEVGDKVAHSKVAHIFRFLRTRGTKPPDSKKQNRKVKRTNPAFVTLSDEE